MQYTIVDDSGLCTELPPDGNRIVYNSRYIRRCIGKLIGVLVGPRMLMRFTDPLAGRIVVVRAQVQGIDTTRRAMQQGVRQLAGELVQSALDVKWIARLGIHLGAEFDGRRMIIIFAPLQVSVHPLCLVAHDRVELGLCNRHTDDFLIKRV